MRGGRDERDDECSLGFDSHKDDLDGCYAEADCCFDRASTGPFGYVPISLSEGRVSERGGGDEGRALKTIPCRG